MLKTNKDRLVMQSVTGEIKHPRVKIHHRISHDGIPQVLPGVGAITYNVFLGDSAMEWVGDHVEPGVSIRNPVDDHNAAVMTLSSIGNEAKVISGEGKGLQGFVTGGHGGVDHTILYFKKEDLDKLAVGDNIQIKARGLGLKLLDYPDIKVMSIDPDLFDKIDIKEKDGKLEVPVVAEVPPYLMGSGLGSIASESGDYDIMTADKEEIKKWGLDKLRFGDLVLLKDCDNMIGRGYYSGSVSVGVIIHSDCIMAGHGPGVLVIMSCKESKIIPRLDKKANIGYYMDIL